MLSAVNFLILITVFNRWGEYLDEVYYPFDYTSKNLCEQFKPEDRVREDGLVITYRCVDSRSGV